LPDATLRRLADVPRGVTLIGIDEDTALVGGIEDWEVRGRGSAWVFAGTTRAEHPAGSTVRIPFP
jgi:cyanophycinase